MLVYINNDEDDSIDRGYLKCRNGESYKCGSGSSRSNVYDDDDDDDDGSSSSSNSSSRNSSSSSSSSSSSMVVSNGVYYFATYGNKMPATYLVSSPTQRPAIEER